MRFSPAAQCGHLPQHERRTLPREGVEAVIAANRDRITTLGVNWYPCGGIKVQANAMRESIPDANDAALPEKPTF